MELFIVVTERDEAGILFARIHFDKIEVREGWEVIASRTFALKGKANFYLKHVRFSYQEHNISIAPTYIKKKVPRSHTRSRAPQGR